MIIKPFSITKNGYSELKKINEITPEFNYNENWLQKVIHDNPQAYPIENNLDTDLKFISLGREINSGSGYIDILLLTSEAELIIVETKLWRNPEKSRAVLAQVIDYAKELSRWSFDDLDKAVISAQRKENGEKILSLIDLIKKEFHNLNQIDFIDILTQNLQDGTLRLSIMGDKISPNLLLLSDTLQSSPGLNFSLELIEIKLFSYNNEVLIIPDIIGKTKEVVRGVVKIQYEKEKPISEVKYVENDKSKSSRTKTNKKTFISQCPDDISQKLDSWLDNWLTNERLSIYWGSSGFSIRRKFDGKWKSILDIYPYAISLITKDMAEKINIPNNIYNEYLEGIFNIEGIKSAYSERKRYIKYNTMPTQDIEQMLESVEKLIIDLVK